jgi:predicted pyridoxine 5'-phosphate oxidase superfamily flavin-nucleotide-binding protein
MSNKFTSDIAFTPAVKAAQQQRGSRDAYARQEERGGWPETITADLVDFISHRESFYIGTANAEGHPYIQHRGGRAGFLKVLDDRTLAFADFVGNAQYISLGNLAENNRAFLFLMDYPNRRRIKIWGTAEIVEGNEDLVQRVRDLDYPGSVERVFVFHVTAWNANCPQHIQPGYTESEIGPHVESLSERIAELETENRTLKQKLRTLSNNQ